MYESNIPKLQARRLIRLREAQVSLDPEGLYRLYFLAYGEELASKVRANAILQESSE